MSCTGLSRTQLRIHGSTPLYTPPSEVSMGRPCAVTLDPLVRQPKSNPRRTPGPRHPAVPVRTKSLPPRHSCPRVYHPARSVTGTSVSADGIHGARDNLGCTAMRHAQIMEIVERYIEHRDANLSPPAPLPLPVAIFIEKLCRRRLFSIFPQSGRQCCPARSESHSPNNPKRDVRGSTCRTTPWTSRTEMAPSREFQGT